MTIIPARDAGRVGRKSALREETLFIFHHPLRECVRQARQGRGIQPRQLV